MATFGGDRIDGDSLEALSSPRCAAIAGFNLHGNVAIGPRDRERLERLLRYAARPAVALERLSRLPDGRLVYRLKRMWSDGSTDVVNVAIGFIGDPVPPFGGGAAVSRNSQRLRAAAASLRASRSQLSIK